MEDRVNAAGAGASTLDGVALAGTLDMATNSVTVIFKNNLTLTSGSVINLGNAGGNSVSSLLANSTESITGTGGAIIFGANGSNQISVNSGTLTIDTNILIRGSHGTLNANSNAIINNGTISSDANGDVITVNLGGGSNVGTIQAAASGAVVNVNFATGNNSNSGAGTVQAIGGGTVAIRGDDGSHTFTNTGALTVNGAGSVLYVNSGNGSNGDFHETWLWASRGSLNVYGGTLVLGGKFTQAGLGAFNRPTPTTGTVLEDGTINGGLTLSDSLGV